MYYKRFSLVSAMLLLGLALLSGCYGNSSNTNVTAEPPPTSTPASAWLSGCTDVKSVTFNAGISNGKIICLEGIVTKINLSNTDNTAQISLDTSTAPHGGSLYYATIIIDDRFAFGVDNITQIVKGLRVAVNGRFLLNTPSDWFIVVNDPNDLLVLG